MTYSWRSGTTWPPTVRSIDAQRAGVWADSGQDVGRRRGPPIGQDAGRLDEPLFAVAGPVPLAVASLGVEDPRLDLPGQRVPADSLR